MLPKSKFTFVLTVYLRATNFLNNILRRDIFSKFQDFARNRLQSDNFKFWMKPKEFP